jgi:predicted metal-dependent hydrolase
VQLELQFADLPRYRVRRSSRARRPSVSVCLHEGVVLTLPPRYDERRVAKLLREWRPWIDRQIQRYATHRAALPPEMTALLPAKIHLPALNATWRVDYRTSEDLKSRVAERPGQLLVSSAPGRSDCARPALHRWLARRARNHLQAELDGLATRHGFEYRKLTIRGQRTRWGSCSATGTISLNYMLLFLSPQAARSVVLHELCHTRYMSHGPRFYALLERLEPSYRELDREVQQGWQAVPAWAWPG